MNFDYSMIIVMIFATILVLFWLFLALRSGHKYDEVIGALDPKQYILLELYGVGFEFISVFHIDMHSELFLKKQKEMAEIRGKKFAPFYLYVLVGGMLTYTFTVLPVSLLLAALSNNIKVIGLGVLGAVIIIVLLYDDVRDQINKRRQQLLLEFPNVLTKLTLLVNSGMVLRDAWNTVAESGEGILYDEMRITTDKMRNGMSEIEAYHDFADRCGLREMRKFASMVTQGIEKGAKELTRFLKDMSDELWNMKKTNARKEGEAAASKLLVPTLLIFIGILMLILVPAMLNMSF